MPARSQAQRRWAFGKMGAKWAKAHHFDTPGKLPARVGKKRKPSTKKRSPKRKKG